MKRFIAGLCLFFLVAAVWAQDDIFLHPLKAPDIDAFRTTLGLLAKNQIVRGSFEQEKTLSRHNRSLKSSGNFIIASELGMVWETLRPFPSALTLGRDYLVQSRPGGQRTVLGAQGNETFIRLAEVISMVFTGNAQGLLDNFEVYYFGNAANWELGLLPRDRTIASFAARITMKGDAVIRSIFIYEQNGDTIKYVLSNHNFPSELTEHEISFFALP
ncbi:MAG: outer membrane lipoprotein carrier protein LolA [Spirochaetes bacterium]|nr:outer membrane lipoprotein carrier protein LolA [Spirochaetota bacterium]